MTFTPHDYQTRAIDFIHRQKQVALLMDMGLGKTAICLDAMCQCREMLPALVVAPLRCVTNVWPAEIEKFGFDLTYSILHGKHKDQRLTEPTEVKITNYESLRWLFAELRARKQVPFKTVIFDEASKLKNPLSKRTNYAQALAHHCDYRILCTGTPIPQGYHDLWSQVFILDRGETFGTYHNFLNRAFDLDYFGRPVLKTDWAERIERSIKHLAFRGDAKELLDLPELVEHTVRLDLDDRSADRYSEVEYGYLNGLDDLTEHTEANYAPLRCFCSGFLYHHDGEGRFLEEIHTTKIDAIKDIRDEINRKPLLVAFNFRGERELLVDEFGCPFIDGSTRQADSDALISQWNDGNLEMLAVQCASIGYGLNLQHGGRHMVWMSLPDSGELYAQTVARLHRQGQSGTVYVYRLVVNDTIEDAITHLLSRKILTQQNLLHAMKDKWSRIA